MLTGAQVYYISTIYPETVTHEEASEDTGWNELSREDKYYWDVSADILTKIVKENDE